MAKEPTKETPAQEPTPAKVSSESFPLKKVALIGIPVMLLQTVLVYFLIAKFIVPSTSDDKAKSKEDTKPVDTQQYVFVVKDLLVNPAGTNGTRFLLTTIGLEVETVEVQHELEKKEVQVRDILNTILTSKGLSDLADPDQREPLRQEIVKRLGGSLKTGKLTNVYFSKFIIQ